MDVIYQEGTNVMPIFSELWYFITSCQQSMMVIDYGTPAQLGRDCRTPFVTLTVRCELLGLNQSQCTENQ